MSNRISAGSVLTFGLFLATIAFMLWAVQAVVLEPGPLRHSAQNVLEQPPVRHAMASRVATSVAAAAPAGVAGDPAVVTEVTDRALAQPEFVDAFGLALERVQSHVVHGTEGPITLDTTLVGQAIRAAGADQPQLASALSSAAPPVVEIPADEIPDLARWADLWRAAVRALAFAALLLITYGVLKVEHRLWALGRIGRWAIAVGAITLVVFWLVPRILLEPLGGWIAVGGAVLGAGDVLVPVALALVGLGIAAVAGTHRWEDYDRRRVLSVIPQAPTRSDAEPGPWRSPV